MDRDMGAQVHVDTMMAQKAHFWYEISVNQGYGIDRYTDVRIVGRNLRMLQRGLTGDRARIASNYMEDQASFQAYLLYYWAISLFEVTMILAELDARRQLPRIHSVLDIGSGPGPASFAANIFGARKALLVDKSETALAFARDMAAEGRNYKNANFEIITQRVELEEFCVPPGEGFDLIVASHSLNELWQRERNWLERRRDFVQRLLPALRTGGVLLVVEPSAHYTSIPLLALRDTLLSTQSPTQRLACIAPCLHSGPCPLLALRERPCFSEWPWEAPPLVAELANYAGLDRTSLKAAWMALKKLPQRDTSIENEPTMPLPPVRPGSIRGRVVSEAMRNKAGRIRYIVCTDSGLLKTISAHQDDPIARSLGFFSLTRGAIVEADGLEERGEAHLGLTRSARLRLILGTPEI